MDPLFQATVQATEEAIVNALIAAKDMTGEGGRYAEAIPHADLVELLKQYGAVREAATSRRAVSPASGSPQARGISRARPRRYSSVATASRRSSFQSPRASAASMTRSIQATKYAASAGAAGAAGRVEVDRARRRVGIEIEHPADPAGRSRRAARASHPPSEDEHRRSQSKLVRSPVELE